MTNPAGVLGGATVPAAQQAADPYAALSGFGRVLFTNPFLGHGLGSLLQGRPFWGTMMGLATLNPDLVQKAFGFRPFSFGAPKPPQPPQPPQPPKPAQPPQPPQPAQPAQPAMPKAGADRYYPPAPEPPPELMARPVMGRYYPPAPEPPAGLASGAGRMASPAGPGMPTQVVLHRPTALPPMNVQVPDYSRVREAVSRGGTPAVRRLAEAVYHMPTVLGPHSTLDEVALHTGWDLSDDAGYYAAARNMPGASGLTRAMTHPLNPGATPLEILRRTGRGLSAGTSRAANWAGNTRPVQWAERYVGQPLANAAGAVGRGAKSTAQWVATHTPRPVAQTAGTLGRWTGIGAKAVGSTTLKALPGVTLGWEAAQGARYLTNPEYRQQYSAATTPQSYGGGLGGYLRAGAASMEGVLPGLMETGVSTYDLARQTARNQRFQRQWERSAPQREERMRRLGIIAPYPGAQRQGGGIWYIPPAELPQGVQLENLSPADPRRGYRGTLILPPTPSF